LARTLVDSGKRWHATLCGDHATCGVALSLAGLRLFSRVAGSSVDGMNEFVKENREHWRELTRIHREEPSAYYDIARFRAGGLSLRTLERDEVGDVRGKTLLHLQCHFGLDTLSWARLGATVTGIDFCEEAIAGARQLAAESALDAEFICADIDELDDGIGRTFDIVFTSYGTTVWLPNLERWASLIASSLKPGGMFYIVDGHPFSVSLSNAEDPSVLKVANPYFHTPDPERCDGDGDYAVPTARVTSASYEWCHPIGEIVTALASAGLRIEFLHEFPFCDYDYLQNMRADDQGRWWLADDRNPIPLTYSIKATR
jgi:SAM-dependent methyltransferase